ncbi:MAG: PEP-CTERM sorting domain-containing protein [Coleofasciculus sp. S288]|nr:PEP-CTERM sorting domain-containing protein [Coleofasciculus sp. S288]
MKKTLPTLVGSSVLAAGVALASSVSPASAASITFDVFDFTGDDAQAQLILDDTGGVVQFTVNVIDPPTTGDLRGVFFNILDDSLLSDLQVSGSDVTDFQFGPPGGVDDLGGGANINPRSFDAGVEIGGSGAGQGDFFTSTMFTLSRISGGILTLDQFFNQDFGVRLTSTTGSEGSSKLAGTAPDGGNGGEPKPVPEPGTTAALGLFAFCGLGLLKKNRKAASHS